uniref:Protein kinase domain-containing protein n=1 Tax=Macrostomum lignano TaxID=282301 RepID=A0A1I8FDR2_9PLAT
LEIFNELAKQFKDIDDSGSDDENEFDIGCRRYSSARSTAQDSDALTAEGAELLLPQTVPHNRAALSLRLARCSSPRLQPAAEDSPAETAAEPRACAPDCHLLAAQVSLRQVLRLCADAATGFAEKLPTALLAEPLRLGQRKLNAPIGVALLVKRATTERCPSGWDDQQDDARHARLCWQAALKAELAAVVGQRVPHGFGGVSTRSPVIGQMPPLARVPAMTEAELQCQRKHLFSFIISQRRSSDLPCRAPTRSKKYLPPAIRLYSCVTMSKRSASFLLRWRRLHVTNGASINHRIVRSQLVVERDGVEADAGRFSPWLYRCPSIVQMDTAQYSGSKRASCGCSSPGAVAASALLEDGSRIWCEKLVKLRHHEVVARMVRSITALSRTTSVKVCFVQKEAVLGVLLRLHVALLQVADVLDALEEARIVQQDAGALDAARKNPRDRNPILVRLFQRFESDLARRRRTASRGSDAPLRREVCDVIGDETLDQRRRGTASCGCQPAASQQSNGDGPGQGRQAHLQQQFQRDAERSGYRCRISAAFQYPTLGSADPHPTPAAFSIRKSEGQQLTVAAGGTPSLFEIYLAYDVIHQPRTVRNHPVQFPSFTVCNTRALLPGGHHSTSWTAASCCLRTTRSSSCRQCATPRRTSGASGSTTPPRRRSAPSRDQGLLRERAQGFDIARLGHTIDQTILICETTILDKDFKRSKFCETIGTRRQQPQKILTVRIMAYTNERNLTNCPDCSSFPATQVSGLRVQLHNARATRGDHEECGLLDSTILPARMRNTGLDCLLAASRPSQFSLQSRVHPADTITRPSATNDDQRKRPRLPISSADFNDFLPTPSAHTTGQPGPIHYEHRQRLQEPPRPHRNLHPAGKSPANSSYLGRCFQRLRCSESTASQSRPTVPRRRADACALDYIERELHRDPHATGGKSNSISQRIEEGEGRSARLPVNLESASPSSASVEIVAPACTTSASGYNGHRQAA